MREMFNPEASKTLHRDESSGYRHRSPDKEQFPEIMQLAEIAIHDSLNRLPVPHYPGAEQRVTLGIRNRLVPFMIEAQIISSQTASEEHTPWLGEFRDFTNKAIIGAQVCPDSRTDPSSTLAGPEEIKADKRAGAIPETRKSTSLPVRPAVDDPDLYTNIQTAFSARDVEAETTGRGWSRESVELYGLHLISKLPQKGCGFLTGALKDRGHTPAIGMRFGGLEQYRMLTQEGVGAFNNAAEDAGGRGTEFFTIIDHYAQSLIIAPWNILDHFSDSKTLRQNLNTLHNSKLLLMNEHLDHKYHNTIRDLAQSMGFAPDQFLDPRDYSQYGVNLRLRGRIALEMALQHEKEGFPDIPEILLKDATPTAARILQYVVNRNITNRVLTGLKKGAHNDMGHLEHFLMVGSSASPRNVHYVPFIERTSEGPIHESDISNALKLYGLLEHTLEDAHKVNLEEEGRVIFVAAEYNEKDYVPEVRKSKLTRRLSSVANNAARFRGHDVLGYAVATGEAIVIGGLMSPDKEVSHFVTKPGTSFPTKE